MILTKTSASSKAPPPRRAGSGSNDSKSGSSAIETNPVTQKAPLPDGTGMLFDKTA